MYIIINNPICVNIDHLGDRVIPTIPSDDGDNYEQLGELLVFNFNGDYMEQIIKENLVVEAEAREYTLLNGTKSKAYGMNVANTPEDWYVLLLEGVGYDVQYALWYRGQPIWSSPSKTTHYLMYATNENGEIIYHGNWYELGVDLLSKPNSVSDLKIDGQFEGDTRYYNLMGVPFDMKPDVPGIYIHQGRKVVVK